MTVVPAPELGPSSSLFPPPLNPRVPMAPCHDVSIRVHDFHAGITPGEKGVALSQAPLDRGTWRRSMAGDEGVG